MVGRVSAVCRHREMADAIGIPFVHVLVCVYEVRKILAPFYGRQTQSRFDRSTPLQQ